MGRNISKVKSQVTNYKKYFALYIRDEGLIPIIQKEFLKIEDIKNTKKWEKT